MLSDKCRHCLWILGNEKTLSNSDSIWEELILNAKDRQCFFNADEDKDLQTVIMEAKKNKDKLDDTLNLDSAFMSRGGSRKTTWKVCFLFLIEICFYSNVLDNS